MSTKDNWDEDAMWRDAYRIAWIGASNPTAVAGTIATHLSHRTKMVGSANAGNHPAIQAMFGHLGYLLHAEHYTAGPTIKSLDAVRGNAIRLGLMPGFPSHDDK